MSAADLSALERRAAELGVLVRYEDTHQRQHDADPAVLRQVVELLEADRVDTRRHVVEGVHVAPAASSIVEVPVRAPIDDLTLVVDDVATSLDLRDAASGSVTLSDLPIGCHTLVVESGARVEACTIVVAPPAMPGLASGRRWSSLFVPTYALWERDEPLPSYSHLRRVSKLLGAKGIDMLATLPLYATFLDEPFDPSPYSPISRLHWNEAYLEDSMLPPAPVPMFEDVVDWRVVGDRRRTQLVEAARSADDRLLQRLGTFASAHADVAAYARFMAGRDRLGGEIVERSHVLAQMLCDEQLAAISADPHAADVSLDLPIGSHPAGYETWAHPDLFADGCAVGAPPDTFFTDGQNWGFPPQLPGRMRDSGYALWRQMIERAGRHADMLRIDHVMAVHRLWWIPDGMSADQGVYVRYPEREMLAMIAATAAVAGVSVVGENLGTVPTEVADALDEVEMLGMFEEQFAMEGDELADIPSRSVAGIRTHDMAAFADFVATTDLSDYRENLEADLGEPVGDLVDGVLRRLAESDAAMIVADLDDLLGETRPHNLPGRVVPGIWQRRLDRPVSDVLADPDVSQRLDVLARPSGSDGETS